MSDKTELMLRDYLTELMVLLGDARTQATHKDSFQDGRRFGLYEALSLAVDMAKQFDVKLDAIGQSAIDPDSYLK